MHGWRLRKKTLNPGTVEYCQLWWVYDKLKNIHKHSTSKAGKEGGELHRVKCLGHPIFSQRKEAIFRKPAYTYKSTKAGKEFFLVMVPFFTPPYRWHFYKSHSTLYPQGKLSATHSPQMQKKYKDKKHYFQKVLPNVDADKLLVRPPFPSVWQTPAHFPPPVVVCISLWEKQPEYPMETYSYGLPWETQTRWETCSWKIDTWDTWTATSALVASGALKGRWLSDPNWHFPTLLHIKELPTQKVTT